jgi:hypothetical protein
MIVPCVLVMQALAFLQTDVVKLRILECTSLVLIAAYSFLHTSNYLDCHFVWSLLHLAINLRGLLSTIRDYVSSLYWTEDDVDIKLRLFSSFTTSEYKAIKDKWELRTLEDGEVLLEENQEVKTLYLIVSGFVSVSLEEQHIGAVPAGPPILPYLLI